MPDQGAHTLQAVHHPRYAGHLFLLSALYAAAFLCFFTPWEGGGALEEALPAARAASLISRGETDFSDEVLRMRVRLVDLPSGLFRVTVAGSMEDPGAVGASLLAAPFWLLGNAAAIMLDEGGGDDPFTISHRLFVSWGAALYGFAALLLLWRTACRFVASQSAAVAAATVFFGSTAFIWCFKHPSAPPAFALFSAALFFYVAVSCAPYMRWRHAVWLGGAGGLMVLTDWRAAPLLVAPFFFAFVPRAKRAWDAPEIMDEAPETAEIETGEDDAGPTGFLERLRCDGVAGFAWCVVFVLTGAVVFLLALSPQCALWAEVYGDPFRLPWTLGPAGETFTGFAPPFSFERWGAALVSPEAGLLAWNPGFLFPAFGLLLLTLRREAAGVFALVLAAAASALGGFALVGSSALAGPAISVALVPLLTLGTAGLLNEMRSRSTRGLVAMVLAGAALANVLIAAAIERGVAVYPAPWRTPSTWTETAAAAADHPLAWLSDSLLTRYMSQGPAPLEYLGALLAMTVLFPVVSWLGLRWFMPVARRVLFLETVVLLLLVAVLGFNVRISGAGTPAASRNSNNLVKRLVEEFGAPGGALPTEPAAAAAMLARLEHPDRMIYDADLPLAAAAVLRARLPETDAPTSSSSVHLLAARGVYAARLAVCLSEPDAAVPPPRSAPDRKTAQRILQIVLERKGPTYAMDWLGGAFLPAADYWFLRSTLFPPQSAERLDALRRVLERRPADPGAAPVLWRAYREQKLFAAAEDVRDRLERVGGEQITLLREVENRTGRPEPLAAHYAEALEATQSSASASRRRDSFPEAAAAPSDGDLPTTATGVLDAPSTAPLSADGPTTTGG